MTDWLTIPWFLRRDGQQRDFWRDDMTGEMTDKPINIIFDGPPSHESGRFIEVETDDGVGIGEQIAELKARVADLESEVKRLHEEARDLNAELQKRGGGGGE